MFKPSELAKAIDEIAPVWPSKMCVHDPGELHILIIKKKLKNLIFLQMLVAIKKKKERR